jgi:putative DNA primase/helicase
MFSAYAKWAKENNEFEMKSTKFGIELSKKFNKYHARDGWHYRGIALSGDFKPYQVKFGT